MQNNPTFKEKQKKLFKRIKYLRDNMTKSEIIMKNKLEKNGISFICQKSFIKGNCFCIVDFYLPKPYKICLEIDGKYHEKRESYDNWRDNYLRGRGFTVIRIKNEDVDDFDIEKIPKNY